MEFLIEAVITIVCAVAASSGFWAYMDRKGNKKSSNNKLLLGLAHDRIVELGMEYIRRGDWITKDEYENLYDYLYVPYKNAGGNGAVERVMKEVDSKLRIVANDYKED